MLSRQWSASRGVATVLAMLAALGLGGRALASTTATVTVSGAEQPGDSGGITLSFASFVETVPYGPYSTPASIASAFGAVFSRDYLPSGLCAIANGAVVTFKLQSGGFGALTVIGPTNSFQIASSGFSSQEGGGAGGGGSQGTSVYSYAASYDGVSNVAGSFDSVMGTSTFSYDNLNRLTAAQATAGPNRGLQTSWSYDSFGNRLGETFSGTAQIPVPGNTSATYNLHNQVSSTSLMLGGPLDYDAAGDVIEDNQNQYLYNADGRICAAKNLTTGELTGYLYDAGGNRVAKGTIANMTSCDPAVNGFVASSEKDSILNQQGEQMTETTVSPSTGAMVSAHVNVWVGAAPLATYAMASQGAPLSFYFDDPLGTRRVETDYAGDTLEQCSSLPYGDGENCQPTPTEHLFTGKERDTESGNDYFGARYYGSSMGRFMSPDPSGLVFASLANPQSLNLYAYAQNNPLIYTDPTGLDCAYLNNAGNGVESVDQQSNSGECGKNGGYWVDGGLTDININANQGTVQMTGTNDGTDTTHASYQDTNVFVDSWLNTSMNPPGHITIGLAGQQQVGQNPRSDADFLSNILLNGFKYNVVPGAIQNESPGQLRSFALIPVTGMQAQMIQNSINQSTTAPPNYSLNPALGLDCATWAQQVLKDAGIQTGPMQPYPNDLMNQLSNTYTVLPGHP